MKLRHRFFLATLLALSLLGCVPATNTPTDIPITTPPPYTPLLISDVDAQSTRVAGNVGTAIANASYPIENPLLNEFISSPYSKSVLQIKFRESSADCNCITGGNLSGNLLSRITVEGKKSDGNPTQADLLVVLTANHGMEEFFSKLKNGKSEYYIELSSPAEFDNGVNERTFPFKHTKIPGTDMSFIALLALPNSLADRIPIDLSMFDNNQTVATPGNPYGIWSFPQGELGSNLNLPTVTRFIGQTEEDSSLFFMEGFGIDIGSSGAPVLDLRSEERV